MDDAWVGPLYWIQWAGGHRRLHPRGRRTGPGGELRLPDCALRAVAEAGCSAPAINGRFGRISPPTSELNRVVPRFNHGSKGAH